MRVKVLLLILVLAITFSAQEKSPQERLSKSEGRIKTAAFFKESVVLPMDNSKIEAYRLTVIPTFYGPVSFRLESSAGRYRLFAKQLKGEGGYEIGEIKRSRTRSISRREWRKFLRLLKAVDFWQTAYLEPEESPAPDGSVLVCLDGSEWTLEGVKDGSFHAINRYCPSNPSFTAVGLYLLQLSRLPIKKYDLFH